MARVRHIILTDDIRHPTPRCRINVRKDRVMRRCYGYEVHELAAPNGDVYYEGVRTAWNPLFMPASTGCYEIYENAIEACRSAKIYEDKTKVRLIYRLIILVIVLAIVGVGVWSLGGFLRTI